MTTDRKVSVNFGVSALAWVIILLLLKTNGVISWGWIWVFVPLWGPVLLILCLFLLAIFIKIISK